VDVNVFFDLKRKATAVNWFKDQRREYFLPFSKSDFTPRLKEIALKENLLLANGFDLQPLKY